jgi:hypothetical protein
MPELWYLGLFTYSLCLTFFVFNTGKLDVRKSVHPDFVEATAEDERLNNSSSYLDGQKQTWATVQPS